MKSKAFLALSSMNQSMAMAFRSIFPSGRKKLCFIFKPSALLSRFRVQGSLWLHAFREHGVDLPALSRGAAIAAIREYHINQSLRYTPFPEVPEEPDYTIG